MKIALFSLAFCMAWLGAGLLIDDYVKLHDEVSQIHSIQHADRSLKKQDEGKDAAGNVHGPQKVGGGDREQGQEEPKWTDVALAWLTFAIAAFTLGLFWDGREKGRKELRAYLGLKDYVIKRLPTGQFQAVITVQNSGQTMAHDVRHALEVDIGGEDGPARGFEIGNLSGPMPLAPSAQCTIRQVLWQLDPTDANAVRQIGVGGTGRFAFVWGRIEYSDIYDKTQHVDFRFDTREVITENILDTNGFLVSVRVAGWPLQPMTEGNDAS